MSNSSSINSRHSHVATLQSVECTSETIPTGKGKDEPSKIERGVRLNPMQKDFLTKFESLRRDARDVSSAFTQHAVAQCITIAPRVPASVKKIKDN